MSVCVYVDVCGCPESQKKVLNTLKLQSRAVAKSPNMRHGTRPLEKQ